MHKDSSGHVGFIYKAGKISSLVKDSSAARNGLLTEHYLCEINGQNVIGLKVRGLYFVESKPGGLLQHQSEVAALPPFQDSQIKDILTTSPTAMTVTIMPKFIYEHMIKR